MLTCIVIGPGTTEAQFKQAINQYEHKNIFLALDTPHTNQSFDLKPDLFGAVSLYNASYCQNNQIVFLNSRDYNSSSRNIKLQNIVLIIDKEELVRISAPISKDTTVLMRTKQGELRKAKNAELQSILR